MGHWLVDSTPLTNNAEYYGSLPQTKEKGPWNISDYLKPPDWSSLWGPLTHKTRVANPKNMTNLEPLTSLQRWILDIQGPKNDKLPSKSLDWGSLAQVLTLIQWPSAYLRERLDEPLYFVEKIASPATCSLKSTLNLEDELGMSWVVASYASRWKRGKHSDWRNLQNDTGTCHGRLSLFLLNSLFSTCTFLPRALAAGKKPVQTATPSKSTT